MSTQNRMKRFTLLFLTSVFLSITTHSYAISQAQGTLKAGFEQLALDSDLWSLAHETESLTIFTQSIETSGFSAFKAIGVIEQPLSSLLAVISDPYSCPQWVEGCQDSGPLLTPNKQGRYGYALNYLPWPFFNREVSVKIHTDFQGNTSTGQQAIVYMNTDGIRRASIPDNTVQIDDSQSVYVFESLEAGRTRVTWVQHTNPSGSLPSWLVNAKLIDIPMNSFPKLVAVSKTEKYKNSSLVIQDGKLIDIILGDNTSVSTLFSEAKQRSTEPPLPPGTASEAEHDETR